MRNGRWIYWFFALCALLAGLGAVLDAHSAERPEPAVVPYDLVLAEAERGAYQQFQAMGFEQVDFAMATVHVGADSAPTSVVVAATAWDDQWPEESAGRWVCRCPVLASAGESGCDCLEAEDLFVFACLHPEMQDMTKLWLAHEAKRTAEQQLRDRSQEVVSVEFAFTKLLLSSTIAVEDAIVGFLVLNPGGSVSELKQWICGCQVLNQMHSPPCRCSADTMFAVMDVDM